MLPWYLPMEPAVVEKRNIRLLQSNLYSGNENLHTLRELVRSESINILAVQELTGSGSAELQQLKK